MLAAHVLDAHMGGVRRHIGRTAPRSHHIALLFTHVLFPVSGVDLSLANDQAMPEHIFSGIDLTLATAV